MYSKQYDVLQVIEYAPDRSRWVKIGVGFQNKDGSINLKLDSIPLRGKIQIREKDRFKEEETIKLDQ